MIPVIVYNMAIVQDCGSYWDVINVEKNTAQGFITDQEKRMNLSYSSYQIIRQALEEGKTVHIDKTLQSDEVTLGEFKIIDTDVEHVLDDAKMAALKKVRPMITPEFARISGLTLYGFMVLNNDLVDAGYVFTNKNREEKYLEIIETGNEELINKLEEYLKYRDEIDRVAFLERRFSSFKQNVLTASNIDEVKKLESDFLTEFYRAW